MRNCNCEYGDKARAGFRKDVEPTCPKTAVIPALSVDNINGLKNLADVLVHVRDNNTTYYIDDKSRFIVTWAGPVEQDDYDYVNNPLNLRSQSVYDFKNNREVYYDKLGKYRIKTLIEETPTEEA